MPKLQVPQDQTLVSEADMDFGAVLGTTSTKAKEAVPPQSGDQSVSIPFDDVTERAREVDQAAEAAAAASLAVLRTTVPVPAESVQEYNERVKREFTEKVLEARRQAAAPPPPPQPVAPAIAEQTRREMAAGAKQSAYWAEQQKQRPAPNARDIAAAGHTTPVFQPASYVHEKGVGVKGKDYTVQNLPGR